MFVRLVLLRWLIFSAVQSQHFAQVLKTKLKYTKVLNFVRFRRFVLVVNEPENPEYVYCRERMKISSLFWINFLITRDGQFELFSEIIKKKFE